jgi:hypothetical protein
MSRPRPIMWTLSPWTSSPADSSIGVAHLEARGSVVPKLIVRALGAYVCSVRIGLRFRLCIIEDLDGLGGVICEG